MNDGLHARQQITLLGISGVSRIFAGKIKLVER